MVCVAEAVLLDIGMVCPPRYGHAAAPLGDGLELVVCGGGDAEEGRFEADLAVLDTRTWRWSRPITQVDYKLFKRFRSLQ